MLRHTTAPLPRSRIATLCVAILGFASLGATSTVYGDYDCTEPLNNLNRTIAQAGDLIGDDEAVSESGYLKQARTLRKSALILQSRGDIAACEEVVAEAGKLVAEVSSPTVFFAEDLIGQRVINPQGEDLGEIENILVDLDYGVVAYALLASGGLLGLGEELIPVPFNKLSKQSDENEYLMLSLSLEGLQKAPRYESGEKTVFSRRAWASRVYSFYGEDPYWSAQGNSDSEVSFGKLKSMNTGVETGDRIKTDTLTETDQKSVERETFPVEDVGDMFAVLDNNNDGALNKDESRREFVIYKRFSELDSDGNGNLSKEEFSLVSQTNNISNSGESLIPKTKDALPEESWTGGKIEKEAESSSN